MSLFLYVFLCLSFCLPVCLSFLSIYLCDYLSVFQFLYVCLLFVCISSLLSIYLSVCCSFYHSSIFIHLLLLNITKIIASIFSYLSQVYLVSSYFPIVVSITHDILVCQTLWLSPMCGPTIIDNISTIKHRCYTTQWWWWWWW